MGELLRGQKIESQLRVLHDNSRDNRRARGDVRLDHDQRGKAFTLQWLTFIGFAISLLARAIEQALLRPARNWIAPHDEPVTAVGPGEFCLPWRTRKRHPY